MRIKTITAYCMSLGLLIAVTTSPLHSMDFKKDLISLGKRTAVEIPLGFVLACLNTLFHELGHASTRYALTGAIPHIYLGSTTNSTELIETPLVTINGFSPIDGRTSYGATDSTLNWQGEVLMDVAGPLLGILFSAGCNALLSKLYKNPTILFILFMKVLYGFNVLQLVPTKNPGVSDGYHILQKIGVSENTLEALDKYGQIPCYIIGTLLFLAAPFITYMKSLSRGSIYKTE